MTQEVAELPLLLEAAFLGRNALQVKAHPLRHI